MSSMADIDAAVRDAVAAWDPAQGPLSIALRSENFGAAGMVAATPNLRFFYMSSLPAGTSVELIEDVLTAMVQESSVVGRWKRISARAVRIWPGL